jgi:capsular polysaccharide biosynthesis protein
MTPAPLPPAPPGVVLHRVAAAGFAAPPPDVRNAHLIPAPEHAAMQPAWTWGRYPPAEIQLVGLRDVTLAEEGLVFLPGLDLVHASVTQHAPSEIDDAMVAIVIDDGPVLDGPHVLCVKRGAYNYGHWLAEMLPAALLANRLLGPEVRFLVPPAGGAMGETIRASLQMAGIGLDRIVPFGPAPCQVRELVMVHGLSNHGLYLSPVVAELLQALAEPVTPARPGARLWVSRAGSPRSLCHEAEFAAILQTLGWQVAETGGLAFRDQVALFKGAAMVAGVMGAGLANLLFAPAGARAEVFAPAGMPDTFFYLISCLRGLRYRETRCVQTTHSYGPMPWDGGLVEGLPQALAALGGA